jgi:hypothetical protein
VAAPALAVRPGRVDLPDGRSFLPLYFTVLAVQFLHFAEEFVTGFNSRFPAMYGGDPYPLNTFATGSPQQIPSAPPLGSADAIVRR